MPVERYRESGIVAVDTRKVKATVEQTLLWRASLPTDLLSPEARFFRLIQQLALEMEDPKFAANAAFLTISMILGESTRALFARISNYELLQSYAWLFDPSFVASQDEGDILVACDNLFRPGGYTRKAIYNWQSNCSYISSQFEGDVNGLFNLSDGDAYKVVKFLEVSPRAKAKQDISGYGPKLARLAVLWLDHHGIYDFGSINRIGIPVDWQVMRVLAQTNCLVMPTRTNLHHVHLALMNRFPTYLDSYGWEPYAVSEGLWLIGSQLCRQEEHDDCPLRYRCVRMINSRPYYQDGVIDLQDTGRYRRH